MQGSATERGSLKRERQSRERREQRRNGSGGVPRAPQGNTYACRQQAPSDERGPERQRGGLR